MTVFSFDADLSSDCVFVNESTDGIALARSLDGRWQSAGWSAPSVWIKRMAYSDGDFHPFFLNAPVLEERAVRALRPLIDGLAEFLPIRCAGRDLSLLNVTNVVNALDMSGSEPVLDSSGAVARVRRFVFDERRIASSPIFKVPEFALERVFVTDQFVTQIERAGLRRARFRPAGSDEWPTRSEPADPDFVKHPIKIQSRKRGASRARIDAAERRCGLRFPDSLKWLFSRANGARLVNASGASIGCLALRDGEGSAEWTYELLVLQKGFAPRTWFPFADIFGEPIFADCAERDGPAFVWNHDTIDEPLEPMGWSASDLARACQRGPG